jgi:hypothetical protein
MEAFQRNSMEACMHDTKGSKWKTRKGGCVWLVAAPLSIISVRDAGGARDEASWRSPKLVTVLGLTMDDEIDKIDIYLKV